MDIETCNHPGGCATETWILVQNTFLCMVLGKVWVSDWSLPGWLLVHIHSSKLLFNWYRKWSLNQKYQTIRVMHWSKGDCVSPNFVFLLFFYHGVRVLKVQYILLILFFSWVKMMLSVVEILMEIFIRQSDHMWETRWCFLFKKFP